VITQTTTGFSAIMASIATLQTTFFQQLYVV